MGKACAACTKVIKAEFMECRNCLERYDLYCVNIALETFNAYSESSKKDWICPTCKSAIPKRDNTNTPVRSSEWDKPYAATDTITISRGSRRPLCADNRNEMSTLIEEVREMKQELYELRVQHLENSHSKQDLLELKSHVQQLADSINVKINNFDKQIASRDLVISDLKTAITHLQQTVNGQEQRQLSNVLEISGVTELEGENLHHIVMTMASKVGVDLSDLEIDSVSRAGPRRLANSTAKDNQLPRPIVARILRRAKKDELLRAAKTRHQLSTDGIVAGPTSRIYINERLTYTNRILFRNARLRARQCNFRFCWVRDGEIYIRKAEKKPAILIRSTDDLDKHMASPSAESV